VIDQAAWPNTNVAPAKDPATVGGAEQRKRDRYLLTRSAQVIPLLPHGALDWSNRLPGCTVNISEGGIALELATTRDVPSRALLVGIEDQRGELKFAGAELCHATPISNSRLLLGGKFGGLAHSILAPENLAPRFDPQTMRYTSSIPPALAKNWVDLGILRPVTLDRVQVCPRCQTLPTFRHGCPTCGSGRTTSERWIHHFACAHVGRVSDFEVEDTVVCPKCRKRDLIVGADFEYQNGPHQCPACGWTGVDVEPIGHCLRCGLRFPANQAFEQELVGYHVERLDPLAFISQF
jgi:Thaumarchaeal output domain 1